MTLRQDEAGPCHNDSQKGRRSEPLIQTLIQDGARLSHCYSETGRDLTQSL
ncbi:hypothetical protein DPMN_129508 [Dreissena polymorpha]|uniref:Uncharacterized protein n=1 Tax=Dreissena polymorpha TaxID=45954 RepID=A0A9D4JXF2_DREPO|nr:hypothetical protein DPMN_129508 [Dreissena polymorpha]